MRPSAADKTRVYAAYGITSHKGTEVDHVDPVETLGLVPADPGNPALNLFPERNDTPDPNLIRKFHLRAPYVHNSKDLLEDRLHQLVCSGRLPLVTAQQAISVNWVDAYVLYIGQKPPGIGAVHAASPSHHAYTPRPVHTYKPPVRHTYAPPVRRTYAPAPVHSAAPVPAACYPKTSGGNCYRAGEFCRSSDLGTTGVAGNGERIRCEASGSRNRWEPA